MKLRAIKRRHDAAWHWRRRIQLSRARVAALVAISEQLLAESAPRTEDMMRRDLRSWIDVTRLEDAYQRYTPGLW